MSLYTPVANALSQVFRTPQYLILFVTDKCWVHCKHCWYTEEWKQENLKKKMLAFDEMEKIAESMDRMYFLSITGGEAFMRNDIVELVNMFARKTKLHRYQIPTSGFATDQIIQKTEAMLRNNPRIPFRVDVSLDGLEDTHDFIRNRPGTFKNATATIKALNKLKQKHAHFDVGVITTISHTNQHEVEDIAKLVFEINKDNEWMVNIARGDTRDEHAKEVDIENYYKAHRIIEQRNKENGYKGHQGHFTAAWLSAKNATRRKIIKDVLEKKYRGGGCAAGSLGGVIYADGSVFPCELLDESFGNIRDFDFDLQKMWNSKRGNEIRKLIQDTKCKCTQECFLSVSILMQPRHWSDLVKERIKLL